MSKFSAPPVRYINRPYHWLKMRRTSAQDGKPVSYEAVLSLWHGGVFYAVDFYSFSAVAGVPSQKAYPLGAQTLRDVEYIGPVDYPEGFETRHV